MLDRLRQETRDRIRTEQDLLTHLTEVSDTGSETWEDALRVTAMLTALREGSSRQRQAAVLQATASQSPDQQPVAALVASYLEEPDENAAGALRWALARVGKDAVPALVNRADGPQVARRRIVEVLGVIATEYASTGRVGSALLTAAEDSPTPVRLRIVQSLGDLPDAGTAPGRFTEDPDSSIAGTARYLLDR
ncbi:hypothetical protein [Corynebacterium sp.]|uniref:HEAT repeat domain-containing protein n=1 Tax=Corynebacterium sp. TaxID=1720 RepID=UPI0025BEAEFB|nr:hypothetical protein [Corynebacterium sp.]